MILKTIYGAEGDLVCLSFRATEVTVHVRIGAVDRGCRYCRERVFVYVSQYVVRVRVRWRACYYLALLNDRLSYSRASLPRGGGRAHPGDWTRRGWLGNFGRKLPVRHTLKMDRATVTRNGESCLSGSNVPPRGGSVPTTTEITLLPE